MLESADRDPFDLSDPRGPGAGRLAGRRFVVLGSGRLAKAVEDEFLARGADVDVVPFRETLLEDLSDALGRCGADCVLALDDQHERNLRAALLVAQLDDGMPVVMRAFDPALADEIERGPRSAAFGVRAAYSVAHLAAPAFVVAALLGTGEENVATLRLADEYLSICRLRVARDDAAFGRRRLLAGRTPGELFSAHGCQVLARRTPERPWRAPADDPLAPDEEVLVGGQLLSVLALVRDQSRRARAAAQPRAFGLGSRRRGPISAALLRVQQALANATTLGMRVFIALVVLVTVAAALAPVKGGSDRFYVWALTALGSPAPSEVLAKQPNSVVSAVALLAGGLALGLGIALMSASLIDRRIGEATLRRARRLRDHVVVLGLGDLGFHIAQLLDRLDVPCVVVEPSVDLQTTHRSKQLDPVPVLQGDLERSLAVSRIERASSLVAVSENNLLNVEGCVRAKRASHEAIRTVARIFDDVNAGRGNQAFGIDDQIAAVRLVAPAYVDAAADPQGVRTLECDGWPLLALRWPQGYPVGARQMRRWNEEDVRLLAVWDDAAGVQPPRGDAPGLQEGEAGLLVGPPEPMQAVLEDLRRRTCLP